MTETIKTTAERPLRRSDRQLTEDEALQIVRHAPHAVLSTADAAGVPYGVPVNAVYAEGNVYWHGTFMKSRKGDNIDANPKVSLCFVAYEAVDVPAYSVNYASAVLEGTASRITDARERKEAALLICAQHVPGLSAEQNSAYYDREGDTVEVWKMTVTRISGKSRGWDKIKPLLTRS